MRALVPDARVLRVDSDSTRRRGAFARMREQIHDEEVDVLVGTQMLAKGHDFPKLTLVVVLGADHALYSSDFRAAERLFQQLMQVAGRAGRSDLPGRVMIQTEFPEHPVYAALARQDFSAFWPNGALAGSRHTSTRQCYALRRIMRTTCGISCMAPHARPPTFQSMAQRCMTACRHRFFESQVATAGSC